MYMQICADYVGSEEAEHWRCDLSELWRQINLQLALNEHPRQADRTGISGQSARGFTLIMCVCDGDTLDLDIHSSRSRSTWKQKKLETAEWDFASVGVENPEKLIHEEINKVRNCICHKANQIIGKAKATSSDLYVLCHWYAVILCTS